MSDMSAGIRLLEMQERQAFYRARAQREGGVPAASRRHLFRGRAARPSA